MVALDFVTLALCGLAFCYLRGSVYVKGLHASAASFRLWTFLPLIISGCSSFSLYFYWWQLIVSLVPPTINERAVLLFLAPQFMIVAGTEKWRLIALVVNLSDRDKRQEDCGGVELRGRHRNGKPRGACAQASVSGAYDYPELLSGSVDEQACLLYLNSTPCQHEVMLLFIGSGKRQCRKRSNSPRFY